MLGGAFREILAEYDPDEIVMSVADPKALSSIGARGQGIIREPAQ